MAKIKKFNSFLDRKYIDFAENKVNYGYVSDLVNRKMIINDGDLYSWTAHQYERPRRIGIWFAEIKYGSTLNDDFYKKLFEVIKKSAESESVNLTLKKELHELVNSTTIGDKENGHLLRYAWYYYEGCPFSDSQDIKGNRLPWPKNPLENSPDCLKKLGEIFIPYVKNWEQNRKELNEFKNLILDTKRKLQDKLEREKEKEMEKLFSLSDIKKLIVKSTLHPDIKQEIIENIMDDEIQDIVEMYEDGVIVHEDTLFGCLGDEINWANHFKNNLKKFPFDIVTEHFTLLYEKN